jgi:acetoin:2,6-dichlorophenolindophenol oxidoreductase subunit alpha
MAAIKTEKASASAAAAAANGSFSLISTQKLIELYTALINCRKLAERSPALIDRAAIGREAPFVGVAAALRPGDAIGSSHRGLVSRVSKHASLEKAFTRLYALAEKSPARRTPAPAELRGAVAPAPPVAGPINFAIAASARTLSKRGSRIAVVFLPGAPSPIEPWHEALALARTRALPILFICQNQVPDRTGEFAPHAALRQIALKAHSCGIPVIAVDGNDVVGVHRVAQEATARARRGRGPTLIECESFILEPPALAPAVLRAHSAPEARSPMTPSSIWRTTSPAKGSSPRQ